MAAARLLALGIRMTFVPYEAAQALTITEIDLNAMARTGSATRWVAQRLVHDIDDAHVAYSK